LLSGQKAASREMDNIGLYNVAFHDLLAANAMAPRYLPKRRHRNQAFRIQKEKAQEPQEKGISMIHSSSETPVVLIHRLVRLLAHLSIVLCMIVQVADLYGEACDSASRILHHMMCSCSILSVLHSCLLLCAFVQMQMR